MPSTRTSGIIGLWAIFAILIIADAFVFGAQFLDGLFPGLNLLVTVVVIVFLPIMGASILLDHRGGVEEAQESPRRLPAGARSASGQRMTSARPQPRVRRTKHAAKLETIVVEPSLGQGATTVSGNEPAPASLDQQSRSRSSSRFLRARRTQSADDQERDMEVQEQLAAIEQEMAKLEGELEETGIALPKPEHEKDYDVLEAAPETPASEISSNGVAVKPIGEEATSELQAIEELLTRLNQKRRDGGLDEATFTRLREKYLKRRAELAGNG